MTPFLVVAGIVLVAFLVVAAASDMRDRRSGFDPKVRTENVMELRRGLREQLYKNRARRLGYRDPDEDRRDPYR